MKKATKSVRKLAKGGVKFATLNTETGTLKPSTRKEGTHRIRPTANDSAVAEPIKRGTKSFTNPETGSIVRRPKPPKFGVRQDAPRIEPDVPTSEPPVTHKRKFNVPVGATHLRYGTEKHYVLAPIGHLFEFEDMRGPVHFGKLKENEDFVDMTPGHEGEVTVWKDGQVRMATGNEPGSGSQGQTASPTAPKPPRPPKPPAGASQPASGSQTPSAPRAPRAPGAAPKQPEAGSKTGQVWAAADALLAELKRVPTKEELCAKLPGHNPGTVGTQRSAWIRAKGLK